MSIILQDAFKCSRCYQDGTINNDGTYLHCVVHYQSDSLSVYKIEYKRDSSSTWSVLTQSDVRYWFNTAYISASAVLNYNYAYNIRMTVENDTEEAVYTAFVSTGFVLVDFNNSGKGIALGKVSEKANEFEIGMDVYDRHNTRVLNGLAYYESGGTINANTTMEELVLTSTNTPISGVFFYIRTMFYGGKTSSANRCQYAYPYRTNGSTYYRYYYNSAWSNWIQVPSIVESGSSGIWTYRKYSDGTAECFGKINLSGITVGSTLGGWYRSDTLYSATDYPYPITFSEAPVTQMMFQTRNSSSALLWVFSSSASNAQYYLPQCYLIRPVTATSCNGNINIFAKGKY